MKRFSTDGQVHPVGRVAAGGVGCHRNASLNQVAQGDQEEIDRLFGYRQSIIHLDAAISNLTSSVSNGTWPQIKVQAHNNSKQQE
jgi:hypothetical protein